jgi:hypothetical protein
MKTCEIIQFYDIDQDILEKILHSENYIINKKDLSEKQREFIFGG